MALSRKNKKSPPEELPDLAIDELKKELNAAIEGKETPVEKESPPKEQQPAPQEQEIAQANPPVEQVEETPSEENNEETPQEETEETIEEESQISPENSYFNSLLKDLGNKEADIAKLNEWYNHKFPQGNALEEMKEYWKERKEEIILENIGKELKARIDLNMKQLQKLEGEWQKLYFELMSKEDEMKNQEKKLKEIIKEFTGVLNKKGNIKKIKKK